MSHTNTGPWKEKQFVDLWSVVHLFSCFAIGGLFVFLNIEPYIACALGVAIFTGWEIFEYISDIHEEAANRVSDVIVDYAGFFLAQLYAYHFHYTMRWYIPATAAIIAAGLQTWGTLDFLHRKNKKTN